ncbi:MAG: restriction endonuclease subunit S [Bacteroidales bacterium]
MEKGFKNTEVGMIPEDWEVRTIEQLCISNGVVRGPFGGALKKSFFVPSGYKVYEQKNAIYCDVALGDYFINQEKFNELKRFEIKEGDFIISCSGTIGKIFQIPKYFKKGVINQALLKLTIDNTNYSDDYFLQYFRWENFQKIIVDNTQGGAMKNLIGMTDFKKTIIPLPPTKAEQTAIATALNDADALIQKLEQLIAKKRLIKTGAMQELLASTSSAQGKPKEGWEWTTVDKLGKPYGGLSGKSKADFKDGNCPYIPFMNVMSNPIIDTSYFDYVNIGPTESQHKAEKGDLFFNGSSETPEELGMCSVLLEDVPNLYLNSFCFGFRLFKEIKNNGLYLAYYFRSSYGRKIFYLLAQGATRHNLSKSNFLKIEIQIPKSEEQTRIAQILSDMDNEIAALEKQLEKYKMIKQGMMQVLLTGKIRLDYDL